MSKVPELFGSLVFNDTVMHERLPKDIYKSLRSTIDNGAELDGEIASVVANAMKDWAIEHGATHYTHWFQPLTGITAEKHDSFISPQKNGNVIMEFSGKELIRGEPDASSFPSGGLRATFEARGYTAWDPSSYAFLKDNSLYIPTVFGSYSGEVLDWKTPLLRSMKTVSVQAVRAIKLFGIEDVHTVASTVGPEQEYFLIDKEQYNKRRDLKYTGRTLFGAKPPKGQELEDHYFGTIKPRVMAFMEDLNEELWKLGIYAKTEHNEVAPAQHELAPIFTTTNVATDHNQLTMEIMKKVADKHGLACLLHEKPFAGVNGSGKHNNWSLNTNTNLNLFNPGPEPQNNKLFLLMLTAVIEAVDEHQDLLRVSVANAGNDHRLGANEAPPAIVSIYLGSELEAILESIKNGTPYNQIKAANYDSGVNILPNFQKDTTDRNRTSPFAFTGNKFEFRMVGSSSSIAGPNMVLNTIMADVLSKYCDILENASDFEAELDKLLKETLEAHKHIVFNGNNYAKEWVAEAEKRGLLNLKTAIEAIEKYDSAKNIELFSKHKIFSEAELRSRSEVMFDSYSKTINIEALTMLDIAKKDIIPAVFAYLQTISVALDKLSGFGTGAPYDSSFKYQDKIYKLNCNLIKKTEDLEKALLNAAEIHSIEDEARYYRDTVLAAMQELRITADELETIVGKEYWPFPTYGDLLFGV
jgi:glutamine synthetase